MHTIGFAVNLTGQNFSYGEKLCCSSWILDLSFVFCMFQIGCAMLVMLVNGEDQQMMDYIKPSLRQYLTPVMEKQSSVFPCRSYSEHYEMT